MSPECFGMDWVSSLSCVRQVFPRLNRMGFRGRVDAVCMPERLVNVGGDCRLPSPPFGKGDLGKQDSKAYDEGGEDHWSKSVKYDPKGFPAGLQSAQQSVAKSPLASSTASCASINSNGPGSHSFSPCSSHVLPQKRQQKWNNGVMVIFIARVLAGAWTISKAPSIAAQGQRGAGGRS